MLKNLKEKIEQMKQTDNWKQKEVNKIKEHHKKNEDIEDDKYSNFSVQSEGRSVAS